ncbi:MAG TPA: ribosome assembly RNA-binding protein YhbY [bacterium]|nr:ribosome assembly RNA-binding protein YhbY [bacterium]
MTIELTGKQKRTLRALGHHLKPVTQVGKQGLVESVVAQVEDNLIAHELIKVKVLKTCPHDPQAVAAQIIEQTGAALAQSVGRTLLLYRPHPEQPVLQP